MSHRWNKSSGTTSTCRLCGCVEIEGYSSARPRKPSAYTVWSGGAWSRPGGKETREEPPCLPLERGDSVPDWLRALASRGDGA